MTEVQGTVRDGFEPVRDEFAAVADGPAQLVAYWHGERVVDLWTGLDADSLLGAYSATKGAAHLVVALLVQEGVLDLEQRVRHYWPEFGSEGKHDLTLRELLAHRSGVVGTDEGFSAAELADDRIVAERLARQRPYWRPGTQFGYHALVMGALSGEVVRRATGQTVQRLFTERITDQYTVDFHFGLPAELESRFLTAQPATRQAEPPTANSLPGIAFDRHHPDGPEVWELPNLAAVRQLGTASFGGVASARGLAGMYAAAISSVDGATPLLKPETIAGLGQIQSIGHDVVLREHKAFTAGFHATGEYYPELGQGSFGHSGAGGQQAFADPRNGITYGYTRRQTPFPAAAASENAALISALYSALPGVRPAGSRA